jgi:AraC-like DNA-binding protein
MDLVAHIRTLADRFSSEAPLTARWLASGSAFVARSAQAFAQVNPERPFVALVLEGSKRVTFAGQSQVLRRGDVLIAPRGVAYESAVTPDEATGTFAVFITEIHGETSAAFARDNPVLAKSAQLGAFETDRLHVLHADETVLQSFAHFAATLLTRSVPPALVRHRLEDLVLSLSLSRASHVVETSPDLVLSVRCLFRRDLSRNWSAGDVAREMATSTSTLRRQLARIGVSLRDLRTEERMAVASVLLQQRDARVADVASKCGYDSPSKFAKQYRRRFGHAPRETGARTST